MKAWQTQDINKTNDPPKKNHLGTLKANFLGLFESGRFTQVLLYLQSFLLTAPYGIREGAKKVGSEKDTSPIREEKWVQSFVY